MSRSALLALVVTIAVVHGARATPLDVGAAPIARAIHGSTASTDVRADAEPAV